LAGTALYAQNKKPRDPFGARGLNSIRRSVSGSSAFHLGSDQAEATSALDVLGQLTLVLGRNARDVTGNNAASFRDETGHDANVLVIEEQGFIQDEGADLATAKATASTTTTAAATISAIATVTAIATAGSTGTAIAAAGIFGIATFVLVVFHLLSHSCDFRGIAGFLGARLFLTLAAFLLHFFGAAIVPTAHVVLSVFSRKLSEASFYGQFLGWSILF